MPRGRPRKNPDDVLLKSAELTGMWEKKLADMVNNSYALESFRQEVAAMVTELTKEIGNAQLNIEFSARPSAPRSANSEAADHSADKSGDKGAEKGDDAWPCPKCSAAQRSRASGRHSGTFARMFVITMSGTEPGKRQNVTSTSTTDFTR